jgi:mRNA interferase MazF
LRRPVLVVQANPFNESRLATAIVAVITSNLSRAEAPGDVRVARADSGLPRPSVVNVSQLFTIERAVLTRRVRALPAPVMQSVDEGLKLILALG